MQIRLTPKMFVLRYREFHTNINVNETRYGPADVYYSLSEFAKSAKHYGWGDSAKPTDMVQHMGDTVALAEVLRDSIEPVRVRYL